MLRLELHNARWQMPPDTSLLRCRMFWRLFILDTWTVGCSLHEASLKFTSAELLLWTSIDYVTTIHRFAVLQGYTVGACNNEL